MGVTLEIHTPALLPDLVERLRANGCVAKRVDDKACHVVHEQAIDAAEELTELRFFVRAWQVSRGGVLVTLRHDDSPELAGATA